MLASLTDDVEGVEYAHSEPSEEEVEAIRQAEAEEAGLFEEASS
jgi:hypothetical protein